VATCYRHPDRETGVSCSNCGRPICPDCMTSTPVGMRCPECAKQKTKVRNMRAAYDARPVVTIGIIAVNVLIYFGMSSQTDAFAPLRDSITGKYGLFGPLVQDEPYRLLTAGFLHARNPLHVGFNMYILWFLGQLLEPGLGPFRFGALYVASLLSGSLGAVLLSPNSLTVGASGAVFGLMGAAFVMQRARGIDPMQSGIGPMILLNLAFGFIIPNVSVAGHVGGLVGGALAGFLMDKAITLRRGALLPLAAPLAVGVAAAVAGYALA
jgi:membrane associated rhomboid family serine protease